MNIKEIIENTSETQQIELSDSSINNLIKGCGSNHRISIYDGYFVLKTDNGIEVHLDYHSHEIDLVNNKISLSLRVLKIKPFYYAVSLPLIGKMFPYLQYRKNRDDEKLITCNLNLMPEMREKLSLHEQYLQNIEIKGVECRVGKILIKLHQKLRKGGVHHVQDSVQEAKESARL